MLSNIVYGTGFDCERASTKDEFAICENEKLSSLDSKLSEMYAVVSKKMDIKAEQIAWIKHRRKCLANVDCIEKMYEKRIAELNSYTESHDGNYTSGLDGENKNRNSETSLQSPDAAGPNAQEWSAKKLALASELLTGLQATPLGNINKNTFTNNSFEYCEIFLYDLRNGKNIDFIKPVVSTENYDDPRLIKYRERAVYELRNIVHTQLGIAEGSTLVSYGNYDYRIYEIDIDNSPKNGIETIFFAGNWGSYSRFKIYNTSKEGRLNLLGSIQTQPTSVDGRRIPNSVAEIIEYKDVVFILDMGAHGYPDSDLRVVALHLFVRNPDKGTEVCVFKTRSGVEQ